MYIGNYVSYIFAWVIEYNNTVQMHVYSYVNMLQKLLQCITSHGLYIDHILFYKTAIVLIVCLYYTVIDLDDHLYSEHQLAIMPVDHKFLNCGGSSAACDKEGKENRS